MTDDTITPETCRDCLLEQQEYGAKYCTPHYLALEGARFNALGQPRG